MANEDLYCNFNNLKEYYSNNYNNYYLSIVLVC